MERAITNSKWIATAASIWIQCSCGGSYTSGIYSSILKSSQGYDQSTLDTVSVFKDIRANVGVLSGLLYSSVTLNRAEAGRSFSGSWVVHAVGAIQCFAGYFLMWLSVVGLIEAAGAVDVPVYVAGDGVDGDGVDGSGVEGDGVEGSDEIVKMIWGR